MKFTEAGRLLLQASGATHPNTQTVWQNFIRFLQQVIQAGQPAQLSDHPTTRGAIQQIQQQTE